MSDKTLVERLREMVEESDKSTVKPSTEFVYPTKTKAAKDILGRPCIGRIDECGLFMAIIDAIEREYLPRENANWWDLVDGTECKSRDGENFDQWLERCYLSRPRFEDGEPVQFGDEFSDRNNERDSIRCIAVYDDGLYMMLGEGGMQECVPPGERVKRPCSEVLDADGVPIEVGDTVYAPEYLNIKCIVLSIEWLADGELVEVENSAGHKFRDTPDMFTHKQPDSLERIEEDALMPSVDYCEKYGLLDNGCNAEEGNDAVRHCTDCGLTCETRMCRHLLHRQREVMERGR